MKPIRFAAMHSFETAQIVVAGSNRCQDQAVVIEFDAGIAVIIADGAGGMGSGEIASRAVVSEIKAVASLAHNEAAWCDLLKQVDCRIVDGESTCVAFSVSERGVTGASVGDSQLWLVLDGEIRNLTCNQIRKPLLGSGQAQPVGFSCAMHGLLLASTDGFCNYVRKERFLTEYLWHDFSTLPRKLVEMVRLPSGELWDDVSIVVCRSRPTVQRKQRYPVR